MNRNATLYIKQNTCRIIIRHGKIRLFSHVPENRVQCGWKFDNIVYYKLINRKDGSAILIILVLLNNV